MKANLIKNENITKSLQSHNIMRPLFSERECYRIGWDDAFKYFRAKTNDPELDRLLSIDDWLKRQICIRIDMFGSKLRAADSLGITLKTLYNRIHQFGLRGLVKGGR